MSGSQRHLCYKEVIRLFWSRLTLLWKELMCGVLKDGPKCRTWDVNNNKKPFIEAKGAQVHRGRHNRHFNSRQREDGTIATFQIPRIPRNSLLGRCIPEKRVVSQDWSCDFFFLLVRQMCKALHYKKTTCYTTMQKGKFKLPLKSHRHVQRSQWESFPALQNLCLVLSLVTWPQRPPGDAWM